MCACIHITWNGKNSTYIVHTIIRTKRVYILIQTLHNYSIIILNWQSFQVKCLRRRNFKLAIEAGNKLQINGSSKKKKFGYHKILIWG